MTDAMAGKIRVIVWNENRHEKKDPRVSRIYPQGIHGAIARFLSENPDFEIRTATLDEPKHGLSDEVLSATDVLVWWGHLAHRDVDDQIAAKVQDRVLQGMGLVVLHSSHLSKPFVRLMGTSCLLRWREAGEKERLWVVEPGSPIVEGLGPYFEIPHEEMYGERFDIPVPDATVLISWFAGGNVFRSGCCFLRGKGRIFYFRPGHETFPTYHQKEVQTVIRNAVRWAAPGNGPEMKLGDAEEPLEKI
jgi:trehalose utilization protein